MKVIAHRLPGVRTVKAFNTIFAGLLVSPMAGFPLGSALAGMVVTASLSTPFVLAGIASVIAAIATFSIPRDRPAPDVKPS